MKQEELITELRDFAADESNRLTDKAVDLVERLIVQKRSAKTEEEHPAYRAPEEKKSRLQEYSILGLSLTFLVDKVLPWL